MSLTTRVLIALVVGLGLGLLVSSSGNTALINAARWIEPLGTLFINAIRMTVIPLVVGSLVAGNAAAGCWERAAQQDRPRARLSLSERDLLKREPVPVRAG